MAKHLHDRCKVLSSISDTPRPPKRRPLQHRDLRMRVAEGQREEEKAKMVRLFNVCDDCNDGYGSHAAANEKEITTGTQQLKSMAARLGPGHTDTAQGGTSALGSQTN